MSKEQIDSTKPKVLIVDDTPENLKILQDTLEPHGYRIFVASNGKKALRTASAMRPDIILLDVMMPGLDGYEVCRQLKESEETQRIPVIFITVKDDKESVVTGFHAGGVDYITKPFEGEEVLVRAETHLKINRLSNQLLQKNEELQKANEELRREIERREVAEDALSQISEQEASHWGISGFIGKSETINKILNDIQKLQNVDTTSVLITGESGTGKELIARAIHFGGTRAKGRFVPVNCSAIPADLAESTLFGHVRGAFTGAHAARKGYFEHADKGTLFLDEIGDMPPGLQAKLLRVLEDDCIVPVGGTEPKRIDVRIIAATNQNLSKKIAEGAFREDLYYRLERFTVDVPPLRQRKEDIPLLAKHFLEMFTAEMSIVGTGLKPAPTLSPEALEALMNYDFPGNVRELKNIIEHALIKSGASMIEPEHFRFIAPSNLPSSLPTPHAEDNTNGKVKADARQLGLEQKQIHESLHAPPTSNNPNPINIPPPPMTEEALVLEYVKQNGSISNTECRNFLKTDFDHASYLLRKMQKAGLLISAGGRRWARYQLPS